jgi:hypothetical protein
VFCSQEAHGSLSTIEDASLRVGLPRTDPDADVERASTAKDREEVQKIRKQCGNSMVFAAKMLSNRYLYQVNMVLKLLMDPVRSRYAKQNVDNRSGEESVRYWKEGAVDKGIPEINDILAVLHNESTLGQLACHVEGCDDTWTSRASDDPLVEAENKIATIMADFGIALIARRARTNLMFTLLPFRTAGIVDKTHGQDIINEIKADFELYDHFKDKDDAFYKKLKDRSPFRRIHAEQVVKVLEQADWTRTEKVVAFFTDQFHGLTQTKLIEDSARELREEETCKNFKKTMSGTRAWCKLFKKGIDHTKHRYTPLRWRNQVIKRGIKDKRTPHLYMARPKLMHKDMHKIVTATQKSPYFTTSPMLQSAPAEDRHLLQFVKRNDREAEALNCWQSCLAGIKGTRLLVRSRRLAFSPWFLSLGTVGGSALLVLPVQEKKFMDRTFFSLADKIKDYDFMPVLNWNEVEAWPCTVKSPLGVKCLTEKWLRGVGPIALFPSTGGPITLLQAAVLNAFWGMPKTGLTRVARALAVAVPKGASALDILECILEHVFPGHNDDLKLDVLRARVDREEEGQEHLSEECVVENLDRQDLERAGDEDVAKEERTEGKKKIRKIVEKRTEVAKVATAAAAKAKAAAAGKKPKKLKKGEEPVVVLDVEVKLRKYPDKLELPAHLTGENLRALLPEGCTISQDIWSQAWRLQCFGRNFARAWHTYTPEGAAEILIKLAWDRAVDLGFEETCPFKDLKL